MLKNKIIVITGGAGKLGQAFSRAILKSGGVPILADINLDAAVRVQQELAKEFPSGRSEALAVDITDRASIDTMIVEIRTKFGKIDALINNAYPRNANYGKPMFEVEYADFCENLNHHLGGYFLMCQRFGLFFKGQGYGNIVNISSVYGVVTPRFELYDGNTGGMPVEYAAIKAGLNHLSRYFAKAFKGMNIRVNCLSPGGILAGQPEEFLKKYNSFGMSKGMLDREDVGGALVFLLSDNSRFVNGQNLIVDDGWTL